MMNETKMLNDAFRTVGMEHGYDSVSADFSEFKEFKVKWQRSGGWAEFEVSDYMKDAPPEVMDGLAETIFSRISRRWSRNYPPTMMSWITSEDFVKKKQPLYLMRARNLSGRPDGVHVDLKGSYERLIDMGLTNHDKDLRISWTRHPNTKRVGYCSVLMKVIAVSSIFDDPNIPLFVSDYVLYHELIHMAKGFDPFGQRHGPDFHVLERLYPRRKEAEEWLKRLRLYL